MHKQAVLSDLGAAWSLSVLNMDLPEYYTKEILVLGCGNVLFGDDGFGPEVVQYLEKNYDLPDNVCVLNVGTSVRKILFDVVLAEKKPEKIIIIDAVGVEGKKPGELFEIPVEDLPDNKTDDFSMHQLPTSNLLKDLSNFAEVEIIIIAAQPKNIPEMVSPGLSDVLVESRSGACEMTMRIIGH